ncbi:hypothetical protein CFELI_04110 [Corynebacterium felinum]|nr:hypothetical protein CFELI_04110 [Corynebacterium felinum]
MVAQCGVAGDDVAGAVGEVWVVVVVGVSFGEDFVCERAEHGFGEFHVGVGVGASDFFCVAGEDGAHLGDEFCWACSLEEAVSVDVGVGVECESCFAGDGVVFVELIEVGADVGVEFGDAECVSVGEVVADEGMLIDVGVAEFVDARCDGIEGCDTDVVGARSGVEYPGG